MVVRQALRDVGVQLCEKRHEPYVSSMCQTLTELREADSIVDLASRMRNAALEDLRHFPERAIIENRAPSRSAVILWIGLVLAQRLAEAGEPLDVLQGLEQLQCPGTGAICDPVLLAEVRRAGALVRAVRQQANWRPSELSARELQFVSLAVLLDLNRIVRQSESIATGDPETSLRDQYLVRGTMTALERLSTAPDRSAIVLRGLEWLGRALSVRGVAGDPAGIISLPAEVTTAFESRNIAGVLAATERLLREGGVVVPNSGGEALRWISGAANVDSLASALRWLSTAPGVTHALAKELANSIGQSTVDPLANAPERRPDATGPATGVARYLAGLRAGYVYQFWKPADIPDVAYNTYGLNLARFELLVNVDSISWLRMLQGYLRYELAPGGTTNQKRLVELTHKERSGWRRFLADFGLALPPLSSKQVLRGFAFQFEQRNFLVSAEVLKDYWYYTNGGVDLLMPGDQISTTTAMKTYRGGFRSIQLKNGKQRWRWELGYYDTSYRKPYSHSRLTAVDRGAVFQSTFSGRGGYGELEAYFDLQKDALPMTLTAGVGLGPSLILLDEIASTESLPSNGRVYTAEARFSANVPALWYRGFFAGGHVDLTYRTFGDWFGTSGDPRVASARTINDDFIFGMSLQTGYFF